MTSGRTSMPWRWLAALLAGLAMALGFAPVSLPSLSIAGLAVVFYLVATSGGRGVGRLGYLFGLGYSGLGVYWIFVSISRYGGGPLPASLATPIFVALFALLPMAALWLGWRLGGRRPLWSAAVTMPLTWVVVEWVRSWLFTGATWLSIGYAHIDRPVAALAPVTGLFGVSLVVALLAGAAAAAAIQPGLRRAGWVGVMVAVYLGSGGLAAIEWTQPAGERLEIAMVQGNVPPNQKWRRDKLRETMRFYSERTREQLGKPLVIWPETAVPGRYGLLADDWLEPLAAEAQRQGSTVITGALLEGEGERDYPILYNAVTVIGRPEQAYRKRHLVPFGEYVPFRDWFGGVLDFVGAPVGDITPGDEARLLRADGVRIGASVCYEVTFGEEIADFVPRANLLVNVSNDGWFGDSSAPYQHLEMARMRALETGREMLRATNTGITAIIDDSGEVRRRAPMFERAVLTGHAQPRRGSTPYSRWQDWPIVVGVLVALGLAVGFARRKRSA